MGVKIIPVRSQAELRRFIEIPYTVHEGDEHWIAPLRLEQAQAFSPRHNEFMRRADACLFVAESGGVDAGRISAQIDPVAAASGMADVGYFGCLCATDDEEVFAGLLQAAERFLRRRGMTRARGPFSMSVNEQTGLLVEGFDTPPMLMMSHDRAYTGARLERHGYAGEKDLYAYLMDLRAPLPASVQAMLRRPPAANIRLRRLNLADYDQEIRTLVDIFNDAWRHNWGFVPMTPAETSALGRHLRLLLDPRLVYFAELDGQAAGFIVVLPNLNEAIRDLGGNLLPFGWAKLLWRLRVRGLKSARVPLMGVRTGLASPLAAAALPLYLIGAAWRAAAGMDFRHIELSWILEDNFPMRRLLERLGARAYKTYRVYGKALT
ncbi:MAG TPA: dATP pyrophosphohydrolase [Alphaproteobacteria bacterium]|jgi:hypothetical protein|nr:dATP pyrophosphohydrolase [Alphaproteobacteria bacterium]